MKQLKRHIEYSRWEKIIKLKHVELGRGKKGQTVLMQNTKRLVTAFIKL
jgi:hypothetical protein